MKRHWYILGISFLAVVVAGCMQPLMVDDLAIQDVAVTHEPDAEAVAVSYDFASLDATVVWHTPTEIDVPSSPAYRYRLNNGDWHRLPDGTSQKRFENLPTGRHIMEVQVRTTQGQWVTIGENHVDISRLRYDGNGHDAGGLPFNSGNSEPLIIASPLDGFSRGSAQFTGWRIGDTIYQPGAEVALPGTGIFVAYAQWGSGTAADPYQIRSAGDLTAFANHPERWGPGANVALRPNTTFDLTNSPGGWTPIGNAATPFQGTFIGGGTTVRGITIDRPTADDQGFFGVVGSGARISDVKIDKSTIVGKQHVGVLAGRIDATDGVNATVEDVRITDSTVTAVANTGSVSGLVANGTVTRAEFVGDIVISESAIHPIHAGGLIGALSDGSTLSDSVAQGTITVSHEIEGVPGINSLAGTSDNSTIVQNTDSGFTVSVSKVRDFHIGPIPTIDVPGNDVYFAVDFVAADGVTSMVSPTLRFTLPKESGLSPEFGFGESWSNSERIVFRGSSENAMKALNELTITFSDITENFAIRVAAMAPDNSASQAPGRVPAVANNMYYNPSNGHFYEFVDHGSNISWTGARNAAAVREFAGVPGHLVTITSAAENTFIANNVPAPNIWIGAQANGLRIWSWRTGPEAGMEFWRETGPGTGTILGGNFNAWASGEPNNYNNGENSAVTNWGGSKGLWNDLPDNHSVTRYLVEYSLEYEDKTYQYNGQRQEVLVPITVSVTNVPD